MPDTPSLSVILTTPDDIQTIRKTLQHLQRQTIADVIEMVIVAPIAAAIAPDDEMKTSFHAWKVVEAGEITSIGRANAAGIRQASADTVVLAEDHCFPDADWAENLVKAHAESWAAVGPGVRNANPRTSVSWADLFIGYGPWLLPLAAREADFLPGHNTSYKRDILLAYGSQLEAMMESETVLHWDLRAKGHRLYLQPAARVSHTNFSKWSSWIPVQYFNGRVFAGSRVRQMSFMKKLIYIGGSPLIPLVRLAKIAAPIRSPILLGRFIRCFPATLIGLILDGMGQMAGYAFGSGNAVHQTARYEFHRIRHITSKDREDIFGE